MSDLVPVKTGNDLGNLIVTFVNYLPRKEVIHPQLPLRMPCYDFVPIAGSAFVPSSGPSGVSNSLDVTGGEYKTRERIHGRVADRPLLVNPASWGRIAAPNPN